MACVLKDQKITGFPIWLSTQENIEIMEDPWLRVSSNYSGFFQNCCDEALATNFNLTEQDQLDEKENFKNPNVITPFVGCKNPFITPSSSPPLSLFPNDGSIIPFGPILNCMPSSSSNIAPIFPLEELSKSYVPENYSFTFPTLPFIKTEDGSTTLFGNFEYDVNNDENECETVQFEVDQMREYAFRNKEPYAITQPSLSPSPPLFRRHSPPPGWDEKLIQKIESHRSVKDIKNKIQTFRKQFKKGFKYRSKQREKLRVQLLRYQCMTTIYDEVEEILAMKKIANKLV